ncbi:PTS sugar transporter subunit IIA [Paenibacillus sp. HN-1]|uniref:BglG family transcription antiterminator n=1 Tax=Paenibacillus TaxID=44249 RepID=UPI001CA8C3EF|nr:MULTISPECIES: PTS sugar transporter subunit IIA [Paenibacillus]MBY9077812.1 PTS sugar transporter subunit IIA [Paenibacillus sp. CGMCC 1.18879]MBY9088232.1 PTS sugar transporter subunit IIA [Paenibacillus sinensis]
MYVTERTLKVARYFNEKNEASIRSIARELGLTERSVRYEIDRINIFESASHPYILKSKDAYWKLVSPLPEVLLQTYLYVYTSEERARFMLLGLLFSPEQIHLGVLAQRFEVSRTTVKKDLQAVEERMLESGISLSYRRGFGLNGSPSSLYLLGVEALRPVVSLLYREPQTVYEEQVGLMLSDAIGSPWSPELHAWARRTMENIQLILTDSAYKTMLAHLVVLLFMMSRNAPIPETLGANLHLAESEEIMFGGHLESLGEIVEHPIQSEYARAIIIQFMLSSKHQPSAYQVGRWLDAECLAIELIESVSERVHIGFEQDEQLLNGLINHLEPLLNGTASYEEPRWSIEHLPEQDRLVFKALSEIITEHPELRRAVSGSGLFLIAVHFLGSLRRLVQEASHVLLVCGFGYGTTALVKDQLMNKYQVHIVESIPMHKLMNRSSWDEVDLIVSTHPIQERLPKPWVQVEPLITVADDEALQRSGLQPKRLYVDYHLLYRDLEFLNERDRDAAFQVFLKHLGHQGIRISGSYRLQDLMLPQFVQYVDQALDWEQAVRISCGLLVNQGCVHSSYLDEIIRSMHRWDHYSVIDGSIAILHGKGEELIKRTGISMICTSRPVRFGTKSVHAVLCLASKDKKEHIPALKTLVKLIRLTDWIAQLQQKRTGIEIYELTREMENRILNEEAY